MPARGCTRTDLTRPATRTRRRGVQAAIGVVAPARWASVWSAANMAAGRAPSRRDGPAVAPGVLVGVDAAGPSP